MSFGTLETLPEQVWNVLPRHAREIYQAAFNQAWNQYREPEERKLGGTRKGPPTPWPGPRSSRSTQRTRRPAS